jgi:hypothetical protein
LFSYSACRSNDSYIKLSIAHLAYLPFSTKKTIFYSESIHRQQEIRPDA